MKIESYKELIVWRKAMALTTAVYKVTEHYPKSELYGLVAQIRRAAVSVPSNIAEGWTRGHRGEFIQFLNIALGSAAELETQLMIAHNLEFLSDENFRNVSAATVEVMKMSESMITNLKIRHDSS